MTGRCGRTIRQDKPDQAGDEHVVRPTEADRRRRPERRLRRSGSGEWSSRHSSARLALRHLQLRRCRSVAGVGGLPGDRAVCARLWLDPLSVERYVSEWPAIGGRRRSHRSYGCPQDREGDPRRFRLGGADRQHRCGALARALQGHGVRERLSDRQPGGRQDAVAPAGRVRMVVPVLLRHRARPGRLRQEPARLREAHLAGLLRPSGTSTTRRSIAVRRPSTIRIMSAS